MSSLARLCDCLAYLTVLALSVGLFMRSWEKNHDDGWDDGAFDFWCAMALALIVCGRALAWALQ
jgi:hypothetical protein